MVSLKKVILWILVAFAVYAIFTSPEKAADIVKTTGSLLLAGVYSLGNFFDALLRG